MLKHGKEVIETMSIGERVTSFKKFIEKEEANLTGLWRQWEEIQDEYIELGVEVFGTKALGANTSAELGRCNGSRKEIETHDSEYATAVEELNEEIEEMGQKSLKRMKTSEKVCEPYRDLRILTDISQDLDIALRKDKDALFRTLLLA